MTILVTFGFALFLGTTRARASLVLGFYNNDRLFIGCDSMVAFSRDGQVTDKSPIPKIFPLTSNCCVTVVGAIGTRYNDVASGKNTLVYYPQLLHGVLFSTNAATLTLSDRMQNGIADFYALYTNDVIKRTTIDASFKPKVTYITFWYYDESVSTFGSKTYIFQGTNQVRIEMPFQRGKTNTGGTISYQGEINFFTSLLCDPAFLSLRSRGLDTTLMLVGEEVPTSADRIVVAMEEIFELHRKHAAKMSGEKGLVGPPYIVIPLGRTKAISQKPK